MDYRNGNIVVTGRESMDRVEILAWGFTLLGLEFLLLANPNQLGDGKYANGFFAHAQGRGDTYPPGGANIKVYVARLLAGSCRSAALPAAKVPPNRNKSQGR